MAEELEDQLSDNLLIEWLADWMSNNPAANSIEEANDVISVLELCRHYESEIGKETTPNEVFLHLKSSDYIFENGGFLTK